MTENKLGENRRSLVSLSWNQDAVEETVAELGMHVERETGRHIDWYYSSKQWKSVMSRGLRLFTIIFGAAGGLVPLVTAAFPQLAVARANAVLNLGQLGYLLLAMAAACVAMDRFFGFSTAWMRYMTTAFALELTREKFRLDWSRRLAKMQGRPPSARELDALFRLARETMLSVKQQVRVETYAWVDEFQASLSRLEREFEERNSREQPARAPELRRAA